MKTIIILLTLFLFSCNSNTYDPTTYYRSKFDSFGDEAILYHGKCEAFTSVGKLDSAIFYYEKETTAVDSAHFYYLKLTGK